MAAGKWKRGRDDSGSMLGTVIVIVGGAGLCCFLSMLDTSRLGSCKRLSSSNALDSLSLQSESIGPSMMQKMTFGLE